MQIADDIKDDIKAARKMRLRLPWWGVLCAIIGGLPIVWLFDHFGKFNLFLPTFNCVAVLGLAIAVKWSLRRRTWFWITMTILAASSRSIDFVCSLDHQVGSRNRDCRDRLSGFDCDARDSFCCREIHGRTGNL